MLVYQAIMIVGEKNTALCEMYVILGAVRKILATFLYKKVSLTPKFESAYAKAKVKHGSKGRFIHFISKEQKREKIESSNGKWRDERPP